MMESGRRGGEWNPEELGFHCEWDVKPEEGWEQISDML